VTERLLIAVRTLTRINKYQPPDPDDIASLRGWVDPKYGAADDDELARIVIETEIQRHRQRRLHLIKSEAA